MIEASLPNRTTRHHRCDERFLEILEEDFGIDRYSLNQAFMGVPPEPKKEAIALCEWAVRAAGGDPDEAGDALRAWARKNGRGLYHPAIVGGPELTWEHNDHLRKIGRL